MSNDLMDALVDTIHSESNNNPPATLCVVTKVYTNNKHIDAKLGNGNILEYIKTIGNTPSVNKEGIVVFLDGNLATPVVIL